VYLSVSVQGSVDQHIAWKSDISFLFKDRLLTFAKKKSAAKPEGI
jgi:hypothetical protein